MEGVDDYMANVNGNKIREARKALRMSQEALANEIGVSKVTICWYESGERTPGLKHFLKLADVLNLSLDELIGREVSIIAEDEKDYTVKLSRKDIEIINEIKNVKALYKKLYDDPKRTVQLIERKLK